jgi:hypothetical protein
MAAATLTINRFRSRAPVREPVIARLTAEALASAVTDALPVLPPQSVLLLRRLELRLPGHDVNRLPDAATRRQAVGAARDLLAEACRNAVSPAREAAPQGAAAVLFGDEAELLACLARDALAGNLDSWWWRSLLGRHFPRWRVAWHERPEAVPAALRLLARAGLERSVLAALTAADEERADVEKPAPSAIAAWPGTRRQALLRSADDAGDSPSRPPPAPVGVRHSPAAGLVSVQELAAASNTGDALPTRPLAASSRSVASSAETASLASAAGGHAAVPFDPSPAAADHPPAAIADRPPPPAATAIASEDAPATPAAARAADPSPSVLRTASPSFSQTASQTASRTVPQTASPFVLPPPEPAERFAASPDSATNPLPAGRASPAGDDPPLFSPAVSGNASQSVLQPVSAAVMASPDPQTEDRRAGSGAVWPTPSHASPIPPPLPLPLPAALALAESVPGWPASESSTSPWPLDAGPQLILSAYGRLLFLVNLLLGDDLYPDFTRPAERGFPVSLWRLLAWIGADLIGPAFAADPLSALLEGLSGEEVPIPDVDFARAWPIPAAASQRFRPAARRRLRPRFRRPPPVPLSTSLISWRALYRRSLCRRLAAALAIPPSGLGRAICQEARPARLWVSAAELVVVLSLDDHPVEWRLAGLDRDPGYLPSVGRSLRFVFD